MAKKKVSNVVMVNRIKSREEVINEAVLWIDWGRVRKVMKFLKLTWATCDDKTPTTSELKKMAINVLNDVFIMYDDERKINGNIHMRVFSSFSGGIFGSIEVINWEVREVSCGFLIDEYFTDMVDLSTIEQ